MDIIGDSYFCFGFDFVYFDQRVWIFIYIDSFGFLIKIFRVYRFCVLYQKYQILQGVIRMSDMILFFQVIDNFGVMK